MITSINEFKKYFESVDSKYVDLKTYDLVGLFNKINQDCFSGELKLCPIVVSPFKGSTARFNAKINKTETPYLSYDEKISISNLTHFTEEKLKTIMCHEMIHYWVASRYDVHDNHGYRFRENMYRVNKLGYAVTVHDEEPGETNQEIVVSKVLMVTGTYNKTHRFYTLFSISKLRNMSQPEISLALNIYVKDDRFSDVAYYVTSAPEYKKLTTSIKLDKYHLIKPAYNYLIDDIIKADKSRKIIMNDIYHLNENKITETIKGFIDYEIKIRSEDDEGDRTAVLLYDNTTKETKLIGQLVFEKIWQGYDMIGVMDEEMYNEIFPDDKYIKIEYLNVNLEYEQRGFAKVLMKAALKEIKKTEFDRIYINACPMGRRIQLHHLVQFYESFGFNVFNQQSGHNAEMFRTI